jgi:hypothetical protein
MDMKLRIKPCHDFPNRTDFAIYNGDFEVASFSCDNVKHHVFFGFNDYYVLSANFVYFSLTEEMFLTYISYFSDDDYPLRMVKNDLKKRAT